MDGSDGEESALGTHQHWQSTYERELAGLRERGDPGEVWFGSRVAQAMVAFILGLLPAPGACAVLDVGTGNGLLALQLTAAGCRRVTGSDYCQASIELALALAAQRGDTTTRWVLDDVLHTRLQPGWDVVADKGTLDAIGLMAGAVSAREGYKRAVLGLLAVGGLLVVTSCNSSKDELVAELAQPPSSPGVAQLVYVEHVRTYPVLTYGGRQGSRVCTVAFRRSGDQKLASDCCE